MFKRIAYAIDNGNERAKLFYLTRNGVMLKRYNIDINLDISAEQANNIGKLEGYWKFDSLSLRNEVTNLFGSSSQPPLFSNQYCDYNCDNYNKPGPFSPALTGFLREG